MSVCLQGWTEGRALGDGKFDNSFHTVLILSHSELVGYDDGQHGDDEIVGHLANKSNQHFGRCLQSYRCVAKLELSLRLI